MKSIDAKSVRRERKTHKSLSRLSYKQLASSLFFKGNGDRTAATLTFIAITIPSCFFRLDLWDGSIFSYGMEVSKFSGIDYLLSQYSLYTAIPYHRVFGFVTNITNIPLWIFFILLKSFLIFLTAREVRLYATNYFELNPKYALLSSYLFITFPIWHVLHTSILIFFLLLIYLGVFALRKLYEIASATKFLWIVVIFISLDLPSMIAFIPALSFFMESSEDQFRAPRVSKLTEAVKEKFKTHSRFVSVICLSLIAILVSIFVLPQKGYYAGYHRVLPLSEWPWGSLLEYSFFISAPLIILSVTFVFNALLSFNKLPTESILSAKFASASNSFLTPITLVLVSITPYLVSNKVVAFLDFKSFGHRNAMLFAITGSWLCGYIAQKISTIGIFRPPLLIYKFAIVLILVCNCFLLYIGHSYKFAQQDSHLRIIDAIRTVASEIPPNSAVKVSTNSYREIIRDFEANYIIARATGRIDHWALIGPEELVLKGNALPVFNRPQGLPDLYVLSSIRMIRENSCIVTIQLKGPSLPQERDQFLYPLLFGNYKLEVKSMQSKQC